MTEMAALFDPLTIGNLALRNRIVMAPMTRGMSPCGVPGDDVARYYARRAEGGVGLIITEGTVVDHPSSSSRDDLPHFYGEPALAGWAEVVHGVHAHGAAIVPQLWHVGWDPMHWGGKTFDRPAPYPSSPSGIDPSGTAIQDPMSLRDITDVVNGFASAAKTAQKLGFDGIELHAAHGYLIDQFLWQETNRRTDEFGGRSVRERARFAIAIVEACRAEVGPDFPIILRLSQWKVGQYQARLADTPDELAELVEPLAEAGVDVFHCSQRRFWQPEFDGSPLNLAGWTRKLSGQPTITVGSVGLEDSDFLTYLDGGGAAPSDVDDVCKRLHDNQFDLVAVGRALVANPDWPRLIERQQRTRPFDAAMLDTLV
ncbi:NADH:flavin oxidoreductase [Rhodococcus sovatensis]|uniref:NADH:flavin oxidoreductase n=1 Tax=Rhodococcus sovatensis TaxID=1805840 RepID=A0ABZ2PN27_9NOCA